MTNKATQMTITFMDGHEEQVKLSVGDRAHAVDHGVTPENPNKFMCWVAWRALARQNPTDSRLRDAKVGAADLQAEFQAFADTCAQVVHSGGHKDVDPT